MIRLLAVAVALLAGAPLAQAQSVTTPPPADAPSQTDAQPQTDPVPTDQATGPLRPADRPRLDGAEATVGRALLRAMAGGARGDVDLLQEALAGRPLPALQTSLPGDWSCRTLKLGGLADLTVYAPFACTITPDGTGFVLTKTSGSQRLTGRIDLIDGAMILTATGHVADAVPVPYADLPQTNDTDGTQWPVVGIVAQAGPDHVRILMPQPLLDSDLDILDLTRVPDQAPVDERSGAAAADAAATDAGDTGGLPTGSGAAAPAASGD